ncbi:MAG: glycosyltransferase family 2 protein [Clostridium sp.]|uniref:glycosyltransferase family 2 protein n=1 Tax=Clostridium TaxID=1485 RepID=UPI00265CC4DE|nr:glycosyltransferase family 2 protein [uncultured Clostridium sp.]
MELSILLPTLGSRIEELKRIFDSLENQTNKLFELIIVSQGNHNIIEKLLKKYTFKYNQIKINKRGLSLARNIGMKYVNGNYIILADDDAWYPKGAVNTIITEMKNNDEDVICFKIFDPISNKYYKNYSKHKVKVGTIQILKKSSIEICFNLTKINKSKIIFNEEFGLGSKFQSGEENLIMNSLKKEGYNIRFVNKDIVYHEIRKGAIIDENFIKGKSELLKIILGRFGACIYLNLILIKNFKKIKVIKKADAFINVIKFTILN